jgi:hypothetical protein
VGLAAAAAAVAAVVGAAAMTLAGSGAAGHPLFAGLRQGQYIRVTGLGDTFEIETYPRGISGNLTIADITRDYLAIEDTKENVTRIPVHAVKSVTIRAGTY